MHFHLPKPLHGWREFAGEVGIIVIGVLIALGAEASIDDLHWRHQVSTVQDGIKDELFRATVFAYERHVLEPCLRGRITALSSALRSSSHAWKANPAPEGAGPGVLLRAYTAPDRPLLTDVWQNAVTSGALNHMPRSRVVLLARIYGQYREFYDLQAQEAAVASQLTPLAYDVSLSTDKRVEMFADLGDLDRINALMGAIAEQMIAKVRSLDFGYDDAQVEQTRRQMFSELRAESGACVADSPLRI